MRKEGGATLAHTAMDCVAAVSSLLLSPSHTPSFPALTLSVPVLPLPVPSTYTSALLATYLCLDEGGAFSLRPLLL